MPERLNLSDILNWSSYKRFKRLDAAFDVKIPKEISPGTFKFKRKGKGEYLIPSSKPLNFSKMDKSILEETWSRLTRSKFDFEALGDYCPYDLKFEIMRTYYALVFWWFTPGHKRYTVEEILRSSLMLGPSYAEKLADEWDYGIRRYFRIPGIYQDFQSWEPITHYNELPPIAYLIRWEEFPTDIEYMKIPLKDFDEDLLEELRCEILDSLPDNLELPEDIEVLAEVKTSTSLDLDKMKTIPFYQARQSQRGSEFSQIFKAKRSIIPIGPTNTRDAVVTTIDTYNSVKWCDLVMTRLLDEEEESLVNNNPQIFIKRLKKMTRIPRRGEYYWLRDIKKCGLTFPRELFHLLQECLSEKYPDKDFSRFNIHRYYSIWDLDNKPVKTVRGYCLGMANNLVTYIQCMISKMLTKRIPSYISMESLYGNDDSCVKIYVKGEDISGVDAMLIQSEDYNLLNGLNIITNDKKSFWSWYPILFEEYGHEDFKIKHSRIACALSSAMLAPDIKYAKFLTSAISLALWDQGDWLESPIREITSKWGYEYYPEEINYDYLLGGWFSIRSKGLNPMLRMIENCPDKLIQPMWVAMNQMNHFQKMVIRPVMKGTVTKNFSVTGQILNVTYVDTELYDIPELPIETIYLDKKGYNDFYESIYRFNRSPYYEMSRRLRKVMSQHIGKAIDRQTLQEYSLRNFNKLAIPENYASNVNRILEIHKNRNLDCHSLMRNSLSRFLEELKDKHLLMFSSKDLPPSGEYPYVVNYDATPYTERIYGITTLNGEIPEGIYQFSTNPWLPLYEYFMEFDCIPTTLQRIVPDKPHLPIWFMNKQYRNSREISIAYINMDSGEDFVDSLIEILREAEDDPIIEEKRKLTPLVCAYCNFGVKPWDKVNDLYNVGDYSCVLCMAGDQLWRARKRSTLSSDIKERQEFAANIPIIKARIRHLMRRYFPERLHEISDYLQEISDSDDIFYAPIDEDDEGPLIDMFGSD
jgi:hypothetical protein